MKKHGLVLLVVFALFLALGCSVRVTNQSNSLATSTVQVNPTTTAARITPISPSSRLQITYLQFDDVFDAEFFAIDITCVEADRLCFSEPSSLFKTTFISSNDNSRVTDLVGEYSWSPDENKIILSANRDIFIRDMNTQSWENITNSPNVEEYDPKWSRDNRYIYYRWCTQDVTGMGSCKLAQLNLINHTNTFLLDTLDHSIASFAISPNSQSVVYSISDYLYQSNLDGSEVRQITSTKSAEESPIFSPDGKMIAFVRTNAPTSTGTSRLQSDIILRNVDSGAEWNLTEDFDDESSSPVFSPDGKWIAFNGFGLDRKSHLYVVSIDGTVILRVTQGDDGELSPAWRLLDEHQ